ncbi:NAD(P)-dependent alcohol dehydrogenase [Streptomyces gardneri]|nr:NAD(P)-dependent alcohol dehydrogenase [Streptomyces gardneri]
MKIQAALSRGASHPFSIEEIDIDDPRPDEILVRMRAVGICHTDLLTRQMFPTDTPVVLGHEGAGVVEKVGSSVRRVSVGDHVLISYDSCGSCPRCTAGMPSYCAQFAVLNSSGGRADGSSPLSQDGNRVAGAFFGQSSFATHALVTERNAVVVENDVDLTTTASFGCGMQTGAGAVANVLRPGSDARLAVYGAGSVGMAAIMAARALDVSTIVAVDLSESRRETALKLGVAASIDGSAADVTEQVKTAAGGEITHALDTTGVPAVIAGAANALGPLGTLVLVGLGAPQATIDIPPFIGGGRSLRGCIEGDAVPGEFIPRLVEWHRAGRFPIERIVTPFPFAEINTAVAAMAAGGAIKPVLTFP